MTQPTLVQLRLLLWKNFMLKRRMPLVVFAEITIPLVLFIVLLGLRKHQPASSQQASHYSSYPLPSAGLVGITQAFCRGGHDDGNGFMHFDNATTYEFLQSLDKLSGESVLFEPDFTPAQIRQMPAIYKSLLEDISLLSNSQSETKGHRVEWLLVNPNGTRSALRQQFGLSRAEADALLNATVSPPTSSKHRRRRKAANESLQTNDELFSSEEVSSALTASDLLVHNNWPSTNESSALVADYYEANDGGNEFELLKLATAHLLESTEGRNRRRTGYRMFGCRAGMHSLLAQHPENDKKALSAADKIDSRLCGMSDAELDAAEAQLQLNRTRVHSLYDPHNTTSWTELNQRLKRFLTNLEKFNVFQRTLNESHAAAMFFPQDDCNETWTDEWQTTQATPTTTDEADSGNVTRPTEADATTLPEPARRPRAHGLLKVWNAMQKIICGAQAHIVDEQAAFGRHAQPDDATAAEPNKDKDHGSPFNAFNFGWQGTRTCYTDALGLSETQAQNMKFIVRLFMSNPRILYAPVNSSADLIINKANVTFELLANATDYARAILNASAEIDEFLALPSTQHDLDNLKKLQSELRSGSPLLLLVGDDEQVQHLIAATNHIPDAAQFRAQLAAVRNAACSWVQLVGGAQLDFFHGFASEAELVTYFTERAYWDNVTVFASVIFDMPDNGSLPNHVVYKIRQNASYTTTTQAVRSLFWIPGPRNWDYSYYTYGFLWVQDVVERAIIDVFAEGDMVEPGTFIQQFPYPCYLWNNFLFMIEHVLPLCLGISWVYSSAMLVQNIVYEKEKRLKEVMRTMGLTNRVHWLAWFITAFTQMSLTMSVLTVLLKWGGVLAHSDPLLVWLMLELFAASTICFAFLISTFYSRAKQAAASAGIIYLLSYVPFLYISIREESAHVIIPVWGKTITSLSSTAAFGLGAKYFGYYEMEGVGSQWSNIRQSPLEGDDFNLMHVLLMITLDIFVYAAGVWYIEQVHPGQFGLPRVWYFPLLPSYWFGDDEQQSSASAASSANAGRLWQRIRSWLVNKSDESVIEMDDITMDGWQRLPSEPEPVHLKCGVHIESLTKAYKSAANRKLAVDRLSLNLYQDHITALLGHNGAGKTTTMSILTGLFPPTSGTAKIYNKDIRSDMNLIRKSLGMCPQHNVLFDKLTVVEHLQFYARLKGADALSDDELEQMIWDLGLPDKRDAKVETLSGGMMRKLSVAIAFVGGSSTVILDEPTAGVDPYARRAIWDLILKYKKGRTVMLSTHHMDEAEIIADRIAVMADGRLKCVGSPLFLKSQFGDGYRLTFVKSHSTMDTPEPEDEDSAISSCGSLRSSIGRSSALINSGFHSYCHPFGIDTFVRQYGPAPTMLSETLHEVQFGLRDWSGASLIRLFAALEQPQSLARLHVNSYGLGDSTLESIFLKICVPPDKPTRVKPQSGDEMQSGSSLRSTLSRSTHTSDSTLSRVWRTSSLMVRSQAEALRLRLAAIGQRADSVLDEDATAANSDDDDAPDNKHSPGSTGAAPFYVPLGGSRLAAQQFLAVIMKRLTHTCRNWRALFSQMILPALFVAVAMSVALTVVMVDSLPPMIMSPSQYYNYTQPHGSVVAVSKTNLPFPLNTNGSVSPEAMRRTLYSPAGGLGATCLLKYPNMSFSAADQLNLTDRDLVKNSILGEYFIPECKRVFVQGLKLENFVPPTTSEDQEQRWGDNDTQIWQHWQALSTVSPGAGGTQRLYPVCYCTEDGVGFVCPRHGYQEPTASHLLTADWLIDISGANQSQYFLYTSDRFRLRRYGALSFGHALPEVPATFGQHAPDRFRKIAVRYVSKVWYNHKGYHSMPIYVNTLNNAILRAALPKHKGNPGAYGITLINHPMEGTNVRLSQTKILEGTDVLIAIFIITAMSFVPASFVLYLVNERSIRAKHLQSMAGLQPAIYWAANFTWDIANYSVPALCCCLILRLFNIPAYVANYNFTAVLSLFMLYGWSVTPMMYPATFYFDEPSTAYVAMIVLNLFIGITCVMCSFLLQLFGTVSPRLAQIHQTLKLVFLVFPSFCLGRGLMDVAFNHYFNEFFFETGQYDKIRDPFQWDIINKNLLSMALTGCISLALTLLLEYRHFKRMRRPPPQQDAMPRSTVELLIASSADADLDVHRERQRVICSRNAHDIVTIKQLTKVYDSGQRGRHLAVDGLCLGIPRGECFGLLGVNGAGKTTTFKILSGDLKATGGDVKVAGYSISSQLSSAQQKLGYCPQFDALFDELSAREHLLLYARLRGVPGHTIHKVVDWCLAKLDLLAYANVRAGSYSGGTKRKLSTAIALVNDPELILLDEPTTGMDPRSRRFLWDVIRGLVKSGKSVLLTSHSMEECETLCSRLTIMVNGRLQCLGSIQHLKNKYGDGYSLRFRVAEVENGFELANGAAAHVRAHRRQHSAASTRTTTSNDEQQNSPYKAEPDLLTKQEQHVNAFIAYFNKRLPDAALKESHYSYVHYEVASTVPLSRLFTAAEQALTDCARQPTTTNSSNSSSGLPALESYSISQNNLDNVFVGFVQHQGADRPTGGGAQPHLTGTGYLDDETLVVQTGGGGSDGPVLAFDVDDSMTVTC